jgi:hypothetical protein
VQHRAVAPGAVGEAGREARQRHAAGVHDDHRDGRDRDGPRGDAVIAGVAGRDRGHGRTDDAGALLRRARGACRMRQVPAGDDDGDGAAERAVGLHLWRVDPAGAAGWPGHHGAGRVRGGGSAPGREPLGRGAGGDRTCGLPERGRLRRAVHGEHDGLRVRGDRPCAAELVRRARALREPGLLRGGVRRGGDEAAGVRHSRAGRGDAEVAGERGARRRLHRRLHQCGPAPAGDRARGGDRIRPLRRLRHLPRHALFRRHEAGRPVRGEGPLRGGRRAGGDEGAAQDRPDPRGLHDGHRQRPWARSST